MSPLFYDKNSPMGEFLAQMFYITETKKPRQVGRFLCCFYDGGWSNIQWQGFPGLYSRYHAQACLSFSE